MRLIFKNGLMLTSLHGPLTSPSLMVTARKPPTPTVPSSQSGPLRRLPPPKPKKTAQFEAQFTGACIYCPAVSGISRPRRDGLVLARGAYHLWLGQNGISARALIKNE